MSQSFPPAAPVFANNQAAVGSIAQRQLGRALCDVYKNEVNVPVEGPTRPNERLAPVVDLLTPIQSFVAPLRTLMVNGVPAANLPAVQGRIFDCLLTVIAQARCGNGSSVTELFRDVTVSARLNAGIMTIGQFMALTALEQMAVINTGWERVCATKSYNCFTKKMYEPTATVVAATVDPVPSGAIPGPGGGLAVGYLNQSGVPDAFTGLGVGFRVDGSGDNCQRDIARVMRDGMTTQLKNDYLMRNIKGWEVGGTVVDLQTSNPRVWRSKDDLFNESAVCVARNLFGATAFPERKTIGPAVLWAVDVSTAVGFDTELHQTTLVGNRQWRPGEKAYEAILPADVIGYVMIERLGTSADGGWSFKIAANAEWTLRAGWNPPFGISNAQSRDGRVRAYINAQLQAWRGATHVISGAYDFA